MDERMGLHKPLLLPKPTIIKLWSEREHTMETKCEEEKNKTKEYYPYEASQWQMHP